MRKGRFDFCPNPENVRLAGDKLIARQTVADAGLPVVPGSDQGPLNLEEAIETCAAAGYPLMLKASFPLKPLALKCIICQRVESEGLVVS